MKREIKFRGLPTCKDNDELDYINFDRDGNFAVGFYEDGHIIGKVAEANDEYIFPEFWVAVDRNTVGQYTGLHDKNGRGIYESDIIEFREFLSLYDDEPTTLRGPVEYDNDSGSWLVRGRHLGRVLDRVGGVVVGNIYENPELLEAEVHDAG